MQKQPSPGSTSMTFSKCTVSCNFYHDPILEHGHLPSQIPGVCHSPISHCHPQVSTWYVTTPLSPQLPRPQVGGQHALRRLLTCVPVRDKDSTIGCLLEAGHKGTRAGACARAPPLPPPGQGIAVIHTFPIQPNSDKSNSAPQGFQPRYYRYGHGLQRLQEN